MCVGGLIFSNFSGNGSHTISLFCVMSPNIHHQVEISHVQWLSFSFTFGWRFILHSSPLELGWNSATFYLIWICLGWCGVFPAVLGKDITILSPISNHHLDFLSLTSKIPGSSFCLSCSLVICLENIVTKGNAASCHSLARLLRIIKKISIFLKSSRYFYLPLFVPAC